MRHLLTAPLLSAENILIWSSLSPQNFTTQVGRPHAPLPSVLIQVSDLLPRAPHMILKVVRVVLEYDNLHELVYKKMMGKNRLRNNENSFQD